MKHILSLAIPLIASQLISMALVLTDVWMMARLSVEDLAGGGLGASVYTFVFLVAGSISSAWWLMAHFQLAGVWGGVAIGLAATGVLLIGLLAISFKRLDAVKQ